MKRRRGLDAGNDRVAIATAGSAMVTPPCSRRPASARRSDATTAISDSQGRRRGRDALAPWNTTIARLTSPSVTLRGERDAEHMLRYETEGSTVVITIDRPAVRNAVDQATATELAAAFRRFDAEAARLRRRLDRRRRALLCRCGSQGAVQRRRQPGHRRRRRADGADAHASVEAGDRRSRRLRRRRWARARVLV